MKGYRTTILALMLAIAPCYAGDDVTYDARTTGSLGQMHVRKSKKLSITHLNRIKNDYQLQRGVTVQGPQTDLLSALSFIPSAPSNPPSTTSAATTQGGTGNASQPPTQADASNVASHTDITATKSRLSTSPPPSPKHALKANTQPTPVFTEAAAQEYLDLYAETAANNILVSLAPGGFSAADLKTIKTAMTDAASAIMKKMNMKDVAKAMQDKTEQTFLDAIGKAEAAAYTTSAPYIQHMQFPPLAASMNALSDSLKELQKHLYELKDKVAAADRDLAAAMASAQSFAVASDALDPTTRIEQLKDQIDQLTKVTTGPANWPFDDRKACNVEMLDLKQKFAGLASQTGYDDWKGTDGVKDRLTAFSSALDADTTYINGLNPDNNDRVTALGKAKNVLAHFQWVYSLKGTAELTQIEDEFVCGDDTQKADYTLIVNDLTDSRTSASLPVVTFTCYAPLSLSGGIGFNGLRERTFQLVTPPTTATATTDTATPASTIQYDKNSRFQIAPLLLLNVRLCNLQDWGALHASFGAGVEIPASGGGTTSGTGSQPTYLGGLSVSLRDKLYFTLGPFFGRTNKLANGYSIGSNLPAGVTTIPLETKFSAGIGVAVTFKLK